MWTPVRLCFLNLCNYFTFFSEDQHRAVPRCLATPPTWYEMMGEWTCAYKSHSACCICPADGLEPQPFLRLHLFLCWRSKMTGGGMSCAIWCDSIVGRKKTVAAHTKGKEHIVRRSSFDGSEHGVNIHAATALLPAKTKTLGSGTCGSSS